MFNIKTQIEFSLVMRIEYYLCSPNILKHFPKKRTNLHSIRAHETCSVNYLESQCSHLLLSFIKCRFYFRQLQWHPLLLSSHEVAAVIFCLYTHLDVGKKGWKKNYKELITREDINFDKIISKTGRCAPAFSKVYSYPSDQKKKALQLSEKGKKKQLFTS
ncbi:unnamed protein product [Prunus armeniaca]